MNTRLLSLLFILTFNCVFAQGTRVIPAPQVVTVPSNNDVFILVSNTVPQIVGQYVDLYASNNVSIVASNLIPIIASNMVQNMVGGISNLVTSNVVTEVPFSIVVIPDTQNMMTKTNLDRWIKTMSYIETNRTEMNIAAVVGVGDCVDLPLAAVEWNTFLTGLSYLTNTPVLLAAGNHDATSVNPRNYAAFNNNITRGFYTNKPWFSGGFMTTDSQANAYILITNGETKIVIATLEFGPTTNQVSWASNVFSSFPDHYGILSTHNYLMPNGTRNRSIDDYSPESYGMSDACNGEELWYNLKGVKNLRWIVCGHQICTPPEANSLAMGNSGNWVNQTLINYQCFTYSTDQFYSRARILKFFPVQRKVEARTFDYETLAYDDTKFLEHAMHGIGGLGEEKIFIGTNGVDVTQIDSKTIVVSGGGGSSGNATLDNLEIGKIFYVPFDEGNGDVLRDYGPSRLIGVYNAGLGRPNDGWMSSGNAYSGSSSYLFRSNFWTFSSNDDAVFAQIVSNMTVSVWVKTTNAALTPESIIFARYGAGGTDGSFYLALGGSARAMRVRLVNNSPATIDVLSAAFETTADVWQNYAFTWDGTNIRTYVNGVLDNTVAFSGSLNPISGSARNTTFGFYTPSFGTGVSRDIQLDEVGVWNRTLSDNEIMELYGYTFNTIGLNTNILISDGSRTNVHTFTAGVLTKITQGGLTGGGSTGPVYNTNGWNYGVNDGLVIYWPISELSGNTVFDLSGGTNHGTTANSPVRTNGIFGKGLLFDASLSQYIQANGTNIARGLTNITVSAWIKHDMPFTNMTIAAKHIGSTDGEWLLNSFRSNSLNFSIINDSSTRVDATATIPENWNDGKWHFVCGTYDGSSVKVWYDGRVYASASQTGTILQRAITAKVGAYQSGDYFSGLIDEVKIWNRALGTNEIVSLFNEGNPSRYIPTSTFTILTSAYTINQYYTNINQRAFVSANVNLESSDTHHAQVSLFVDNDANGSFEIDGITARAGLTNSAIQQLSTMIQPGARFVFTNQSGATATTPTIISGSSLLIRQ